MRYEMTGCQRILLDDGRWIAPGAEPFEAVIDATRESYLIGIGAIRRAEAPEPTPLRVPRKGKE